MNYFLRLLTPSYSEAKTQTAAETIKAKRLKSVIGCYCKVDGKNSVGYFK